MLRHLLTSSVLLCAALGHAQTVYKCGTPEHISYGQTPCANGQSVEVSDPRTPEQRALSEAQTHQQAQAAKEMEARRVQTEEQARQQALRNNAYAPNPYMPASQPGYPVQPVPRCLHGRNCSPYFTAREITPPKPKKSSAASGSTR